MLRLADYAKSFAHRKLKRSAANYVDLVDSKGCVPTYLDDLSLEIGESLIGIYQNRLGERLESVVVTSRCLLLGTELAWRRIGFEEIVNCDLPAKTTDQVELPIRLASGESLVIPVRGRTVGEFGEDRDIYLMEGFLSGILRVLSRC